MRYSQGFFPSLREVPKDATSPSHVLLLRAGYVRMVGAGLYEMLPLGMRVLTRIANIVRREMNAAGAQEILMPALLPATYFQETGRYEGFGDTLLRLEDRKRQPYHLGPTHEEIITDMVRRDIRSYRQLPQNLYQVQMKYRDEPRPRGGLLRCREFLMKDAYSFDVSHEAATKSYQTMRDAYHRIFGKLGLDYRIVQADSGAMGGSTSAEFQVLTQTGEDKIVACDNCDYAANVEVAESRPAEPTPAAEGETPARDKVHTPGAKSIDQVVEALGEEYTSARLLKSLVLDTGEGTVLAIVRGDHELNEIAAARALGLEEVKLADDKTVFQATGAKVGFAGPVGFAGDILIDPAAAALADAACGANENDQHFVHVTHGRDFEGRIVALRQAAEGDGCPKCEGTLRTFRGIEGGHIFILGTHYTEKMGATFLDENGKAQPIVMGCYGIGVSRLMATAIEQHHDENGIRWPMPIAPFQAIITPLGKGDDVHEAAAKLHDELVDLGVEVLLDDRNERPGVKFKDADLLGIPLRITVGGRGLKSGELEVKARDEDEAAMVAIDQVAAHVRDQVVARGGSLIT